MTWQEDLMDLTVVGLVKPDGERFVIAYDQQSRHLIYETLNDMARDPDLDFTPTDVVVLLDTIQRLDDTECES